MISFHTGIQALRKFKVNSLNERIQTLFPDLELIGTEYIHFIKSDKDLNQSKDNQQLEYSAFQGELNTQLDLDGDLTNKSSSSVFQLKNKYLVNKIKSGLVIINQNRAHQRILYENFLKYITVQGNDSQKLIYPVEVQLSIKEIAIIENFKTQLNNSGFLFQIHKKKVWCR